VVHPLVVVVILHQRIAVGPADQRVAAVDDAQGEIPGGRAGGLVRATAGELEVGLTQRDLELGSGVVEVLEQRVLEGVTADVDVLVTPCAHSNERSGDPRDNRLRSSPADSSSSSTGGG